MDAVDEEKSKTLAVSTFLNLHRRFRIHNQLLFNMLSYSIMVFKKLILGCEKIYEAVYYKVSTSSGLKPTVALNGEAGELNTARVTIGDTDALVARGPETADRNKETRSPKLEDIACW